MTALPGDWVIRGVNGEFYPCKDDIFRKTYEPEEGGPTFVERSSCRDARIVVSGATLVRRTAGRWGEMVWRLIWGVSERAGIPLGEFAPFVLGRMIGSKGDRIDIGGMSR